MNYILKLFKHTRKVDENDKYFLIRCLLSGNESEVGYIEKQFDEKVFLDKLQLPKEEVSITEVVEFTSKKAYIKYKENQGIKSSF